MTMMKSYAVAVLLLLPQHGQAFAPPLPPKFTTSSARLHRPAITPWRPESGRSSVHVPLQLPARQDSASDGDDGAAVEPQQPRKRGVWGQRFAALALGLQIVFGRGSMPADATDSGGRIAGASTDRPGGAFGSSGGSHTSSGTNVRSSSISRSPSHSHFAVHTARAPRPHRIVRAHDEAPAATEITATDVVVVGAVVGGIATARHVESKRRRLEMPAGSRSAGLAASDGAPAISTLQIGLFYPNRDTRTVMDALNALAGRADASTPKGLRAVVSEACLELLRAEGDWVAVAGGVRQHRGGDAAEEAFQLAVTRERAKWSRETVSNSGNASATKPARAAAAAAITGTTAPLPTYAVVTLLIGWGALPQRAKPFLARSADVPAAKDRASARAMLEWLSAGAGARGDVRSVEVLWTPAAPTEVMGKDELDAKWPHLRSLGFA
eukprot:TRINITY_DN11847_c0_g1_i1.p1 TRINITY_DN11847_c0_g1~~TRINITY_DN11847_c0_g1_i1.p1  ORF type:complete len:439 (-),score=119.93 TRINITY_DN11847_c0_g1_i1:870-2186(-)